MPVHTCPDCSAPLGDVLAGEPCPNCGGTRRDASIQASAGLAVTAALTATARIGHPQQGSWQLKWMEIEFQLADLQKLCGSNAVSNVTLKLMIDNLLKSCRELADWLWENPTGLTKKTVMAYVFADPDLEVCDAIVQTTKHNKRRKDNRNPDPMTAWVEWVDSTGTAQIRWANHSKTKTGTSDALELCERSVAAWGKFL